MQASVHPKPKYPSLPPILVQSPRTVVPEWMSTLQNILEQSFSIEELHGLFHDVLGLQGDSFLGVQPITDALRQLSKDKYWVAKQLVQVCIINSALEALVDAIQFMKPESEVLLKSFFASRQSSEIIESGEHLGPFVIVRLLGEGPHGFVYLAQRREASNENAIQRNVILKLFRYEFLRDPKTLHQLLTWTRLARLLAHKNLPTGLEAGFLSTNAYATRAAYVCYDAFEAMPLSTHLLRKGPLPFNEAKDIFHALLDVLHVFHEHKVLHGDLKLSNILIKPNAEIVVVDWATHYLDESVTHDAPFKELESYSFQTGLKAYKRDVYAAGCLFYEMLTGHAPYEKERENLLAQIREYQSKGPEAPSVVLALNGKSNRKLDQFILNVLNSSGSNTNQWANVDFVLQAFEQVERSTNPDSSPNSRVNLDEIDLRIADLIEDPESEKAAQALEELISLGGDAERIVDGFIQISNALSDDQREVQNALLLRVAHILNSVLHDAVRAEEIYRQLLELNPHNNTVQVALETIKREQEQWNELVEMLLVRVETTVQNDARAIIYSELSHIYEKQLNDIDNAFVASVQAWLEAPNEKKYVLDVEQLAADNELCWDEALGQGTHRVQTKTINEQDRIALLIQMGHWFNHKLNRYDLALHSFQAVIAVRATEESAFEGMCDVYRRMHLWRELAISLLQQAEVTHNQAQAHRLKAQTAELFETKLGEEARAKAMYESILVEDPSHTLAYSMLERMYLRSQNFVDLIRIKEAHALTASGQTRLDLWMEIGVLYEEKLNNFEEAIRYFERVLAFDPNYLEVLKRLERIYEQTQRDQEWVENLETQLELVHTPGQKIRLLERIGQLYEQKFFDIPKAIKRYEAIVALDPESQPALVALLRCSRALKQYEKIESIYEQLIRLEQDSDRQCELQIEYARWLADEMRSLEHASKIFEEVLKQNPLETQVLEALARIYESLPNAQRAVEILETLAENTNDMSAQAELYMRAARILESQGDNARATNSYKLALYVAPEHKEAATSLRKLYVGHGDGATAIQWLDHEVESTRNGLQKADLYGERAVLAYELLKDTKQARDSANKALELDPSHTKSLMILGLLAYEEHHFIEAAQRLEPAVRSLEQLDEHERVRVMLCWIQSLEHTHSSHKVLDLTEHIRQHFAHEASVLVAVATVKFHHDTPEMLIQWNHSVIDGVGPQLIQPDRAQLLYQLGESYRKLGIFDRAQEMLKEAYILEPKNVAILSAMTQLHVQQENWPKVIKLKREQMGLVTRQERIALLNETADLFANKMNDIAKTIQCYVEILQEHPDDRAAMLHLMQLYTEAKNWPKLIDTITRLAKLTEEPKAQSKYWMTAAMVSEQQLNNIAKASQLYEEAFQIDEENDQAFENAVRAYRASANYESAVRLLKQKLDHALIIKDLMLQVKTYDALGVLYSKHLKSLVPAIECYEAAQQIDSQNRERIERLAELYAQDVKQYLNKAIEAHNVLLQHNPERIKSFKALRSLYIDANQRDATWCVCQAITQLKLASPDEKRFFEQFHTHTPASIQRPLTSNDWSTRLHHPKQDDLITSIFEILEPAIVATRASILEQEGYSFDDAIDLKNNTSPVAQALYSIPKILGTEVPLVFENFHSEVAFAFVHTQPRALLVNPSKINERNVQQFVFLIAQKLAFFRPGLYVRQLVSTGTGLKTWLFAAIKTIAPQYPVALELEGPIQEAMRAVRELSPQARDQLASLVSKMLQTNRTIDLKQWMISCDCIVDRAAFLLTHDLGVALSCIRNESHAANAPSIEERVKELMLFAISKEYFALRVDLGITIDA